MTEPRHVSAGFAVAYVGYCTNGTVILTVNQIRIWATRKKIRRRGRDADGYALYDLDDILAELNRRGTLALESQP